MINGKLISDSTVLSPHVRWFPTRIAHFLDLEPKPHQSFLLPLCLSVQGAFGRFLFMRSNRWMRWWIINIFLLRRWKIVNWANMNRRDDGKNWVARSGVVCVWKCWTAGRAKGAVNHDILLIGCWSVCDWKGENASWGCKSRAWFTY